MVLPLLILNLLCLGCALVMWRVPSETLRETMSLVTVWGLKAALLALLLGLILSREQLLELWRQSSRRSRLTLGAILIIGGSWLIFAVPQAHRINYDEPIYQNIAQNIAWTGKASLCHNGEASYTAYKCFLPTQNKQPNGFPFLLSLFYSVFGVNEWAGFVLNNFVYLVGVVVVFLLGVALFRSEVAAVWAAGAFAFTPQVLLWADTTASDLVAGVSIAAAVLGTTLFLQTATAGTLLLSAGAIGLAFHMRTESPLLVAVLGMLVALRGRHLLFDRRFYLLLVLAAIFCLPQLMYLWTFRLETWGSTGDKLGLSYFWHNLKTNGLFYFQNREFPLGFSLLAVFALVRRRISLELIFVLFWFFCLWGIFLFFYAGSYDFGADVRYSNVSAPALVLLVGAGAERLFAHASNLYDRRALSAALAFALLLISSEQLILTRAETEEGVDSRIDMRFLEEFLPSVPEDSIVFAHNPNMWLIRGKNSAQTYMVMGDPNNVRDGFFKRYSGGVYFHYDYWCNTANIATQDRCQNLLNRYKFELVAERRMRNFRYALYRLFPESP